MSNILLTYLPIEGIEKQNKYFYFGALKNLTIKHIQDNYENIYLKDFNYNKKTIIHSTKYCDEIYNKILDDLTKILNNLHNINYSRKCWEIITGKYLRDLIYVLYNRFYELETLLENNNLQEVNSLDFEDFELITEDSPSLENANLSSEWTSKLCTKILIFLHKEYLIKEIRKKKLNFEKLRRERKISSRNIFKKIIFYFLNKFSKNNKIFFYDSGLDFQSEKKVELKLKQFPCYWDFPVFRSKENMINKNLRNSIKFSFNTNNNFETFLKEKLIFFLPVFLFESFRKINEEIEDMKLPKNLKLIVTGTGFVNVYFNFFTAKLALKGTKYSIIQHGNGYNTSFSQGYSFECSKSIDAFISWGSKQLPNQYSLFNTNVIKKNITNYKVKEEGYLTVVCDQLILKPYPYDLIQMKEQNFFKTLELIKELPKEIRNKTIFRLFPYDHYGLNKLLKRYIKDSNLQYFEDHISFKKILKNTKICLFNYDSTGMYENFLYGIPSLSYFSDLLLLKDEAEIYFKKLQEVKIYNNNLEETKKHLISIWKNPLNWWEKEETQKVIHNFNQRYNLRPINPIYKLANCLKEIINK